MSWFFGKKSAPAPPSQSAEPGKDWTGEITELADDDEVDDFLIIPSAADASKTRLEEQLKQQTELIEALQSQTERLKLKMENSEKLHKKELAYQEKLLQQEQEKVSEHARKLHSADREKQSALKGLAEGHRAELEGIKNSEAKLKVEVEQLKEKLAQSQAMLERLTKDSEKASLEFKASLEEKTKEQQQLNETVTKLEGQLSEMKRVVQEREGVILTLQRQTTQESKQVIIDESSKQQVQLLEAENRGLREVITSLQQKLFSQEKAIQDKSADLGIFETKSKLQASELEQLRKEVQRLQAKEAEASNELSKKREEIASLRSNLIKAAESECVAQNKLAEEKERFFREKEKMQNQEKALLAEVTTAKQQIESVYKTEEELRRSILTLRQENDRMKTQMKNMHESVDEILSAVPSSSAAASTEQQRLLARHKAKIAKILKDNPNSVPIRCVRSEECSIYPLLEKKKFAVNKDMTLSRFNEHIRGKLNLSVDQPLSVYVDHQGYIPESEVLEVLHKACASEDGFLRLKYSHISR